MDDLSFEEFEIEYKYLKAVIEGGLERKPENILIYATSNRRHLVRERAGDKLEVGADDDDLIPPIPCRKSFHWYIVLAFVFTLVRRIAKSSTLIVKTLAETYTESQCRKISFFWKPANGKFPMAV